MAERADLIELSREMQAPIETASTALTPMDMLHRAVSQGANIDVLEKLMALQERWEANQARKAFDEAIAAAKAEIPTIRKNKHVGFESRKAGASRTDYFHEDLAEIARAVGPILSRHGLSYRFRTSSTPNEPVSVTCIISHSMGHSEENTLMAGRDDSGNKNSIQAIGSTVTYLQRYTLKSALGLAAAEDDDGRGGADKTGSIDSDQVQHIRDLMERVGADIQIFCQYFKIEAIPDLAAKDYERAVTMLNLKEEKLGKREK